MQLRLSNPDAQRVFPNSNPQNYYTERISPPLERIQRLSFTAAPIANLTAVDSTVIIGTKDGRVYAYDLGRRKKRGKIKLPEGVEGMLSLDPDGKLLLITLKLGRETLLCYDLRDGRYLWKKKAGLFAENAVVGDSSAYVVARFNHVDRYHLRDGNLIWRFDVDEMAHTAPALSDELMIFGTDRGKIIALDRAHGKQVWEFKTAAAVFATPLVFAQHVYGGSLDSTLYALDLKSGRLDWKFRATGSIRHKPACHDSTLVFSSGDGKVYALDLQTGKQRWQFSSESAFGTSPVIVDQLVYIGGLDTNLYALDLASGEIVAKTKLDGRIRTNLLVMHGFLVVGNEDKYVDVFKHETIGDKN